MYYLEQINRQRWLMWDLKNEEILLLWSSKIVTNNDVVGLHLYLEAWDRISYS